MGLYDLPSIINYVLNKDKSYSKVIYIGHSQGCTSLLAGMCENFEYFKNKFYSVIFLGPASKVDSADSYFVQFISSTGINENNFKDEVLPANNNITKLKTKFTNYYPTFNHAMLEITSDEISLVNCPHRVNIYFAHFPCGTSFKSIDHFKQMYEAKQFQSYDYKDQNIIRYSDFEPKKYNLKNIENINFIICAGKNDKLANICDIKWLCNQLNDKNNIKFFEFDFMGHISFILSNEIIWFNNVLIELNKILEHYGINCL